MVSNKKLVEFGKLLFIGGIIMYAATSLFAVIDGKFSGAWGETTYFVPFMEFVANNMTLPFFIISIIGLIIVIRDLFSKEETN